MLMLRYRFWQQRDAIKTRDNLTKDVVGKDAKVEIEVNDLKDRINRLTKLYIANVCPIALTHFFFQVYTAYFSGFRIMCICERIPPLI